MRIKEYIHTYICMSIIGTSLTQSKYNLEIFNTSSLSSVLFFLLLQNLNPATQHEFISRSIEQLPNLKEQHVAKSLGKLKHISGGRNKKFSYAHTHTH